MDPFPGGCMHPRTYHLVERDPKGDIVRDEHRLVVVRALRTRAGRIGLTLEDGGEQDRALFESLLETLPGWWLPGTGSRELPAPWESREAQRHIRTFLEGDGFTVFGECG